METCTQTRQVFCETADARIVASDLCGEELPAAERACVGKDAAVCGEGADGSAADTPGREAGAPPAAEEEGEAAAVGRGVGNSNRSDSRRPRSSAEAPAPKGSAKASKVEKGEGAAEGREGGEEDEGGGGAHESRKPSSRHKVTRFFRWRAEQLALVLCSLGLCGRFGVHAHPHRLHARRMCFASRVVRIVHIKSCA